MTEYIFGGGGGKTEPSFKSKKSKASNKNKDKDKDSNKKAINKDIEKQSSIKEVIKKPVIQDTALLSIPEEIKREYRFPLDFVEYLEKKHIPKKFIPEMENIFQVSNCQLNGPKYDVLTFQKKEELNKKFFMEANDSISAITGQGDHLYVGFVQGTVKKYSCKEEKEICSFTDSAINNLQQCKIIMCIDVSKDTNYLAVGYTKGYISLWEMRNNKNKLMKFVDKVQTATILSIKFVSTSINQQQELLSADADGNVLLFSFTQKLLIVSATSKYFLKDPTPIFVMDIFTPTPEQMELYPVCKTNAVLGAFGSINKVLVILLKPNIKKLFKIDNPAYNNSREIPDVSFGLGNEPMKHRSQYDMRSLDRQNLSVMIAISWNTVIAIYKITIDDLTFTVINEAIGYYKNDNYQILRMGFLDTSEIFFLDSLKKVKVLHTSFMNPQLILDDKKKRRSNDVTSLIDEGKTIDADTTCQKLIDDPLDTKSTHKKETYNNFISAKGKTIYFLCKKSFYHGILLTWEESITALMKKNMWEDAIFLAVNIHEGLITTLPNIPLDEDIRKQELGKLTQEMLLKYVLFNKRRGEKNWEENLKKCINFCIEICIQINAADFLFTKIQPEFHNYEEMFIRLLEPFILLSRFYKFDIDKETIDKLINYYTEKSQNILLIQILFNLKAESIDIPSVHNYLAKNQLYTLLIYLDSKKRQYFNSIDKMYDKLQRFKDISDSDFISYSNCLKKMDINDVLISKPYMTHKLLWYCNYCLSQKIFPDDSPIKQEDYEKLVIQILDKFLIDEVFFEFIQYDSYSFLQILSRFFIEEKLITIIESSHSKDKSLFNDVCKCVFKKNKEITSAMSIRDILMEYVIQNTSDLESIIIQQDVNLFITMCSTSKPRINKSRAIEAGYKMISFFKLAKEPQEKPVFDKFNTHGLRAENPFYIKELTDILLIIIEYLDSDTEYIRFLLASESSPLIIIKITLQLKLNNHVEAFEEVIQHKDDFLLGKKKVFEWIYANLTETKANESKHKKLLNAVLDKLEVIAKISLDDLLKIVNEWFYNEELAVIHKLDNNKEIQLELVERVLKNKNEEAIIREGDMKIREYTDLLLLHIKLLIHLNKKDQVLKNLKIRNSYPLDDVLSLCLKHNVNDAAIDIYISTGNNKEAMNIGLSDLTKTINNLRDYGLKQLAYSDKDEQWNELINLTMIEKTKCIQICSQTVLTTSNSENEELWFSLFNELYNSLSQINRESINEDNQYIKDITKMISDTLDSLLKEMCNYIPIKGIIGNVTSNYQDAEFKQFKVFLNSMFSTFSHLTNMFYSTKNLLSNSIRGKIIDFKKENAKGVKFHLTKCDYCHSMFNTGDDAIGFKCKHKVHNDPFCVMIEMGRPVCKICMKDDIEDMSYNAADDDYYYSQREGFNKNNNEPSKGNDGSNSSNIVFNKKRIREKKALKRLKEIDDHLLEQTGMVIKRDGLY